MRLCGAGTEVKRYTRSMWPVASIFLVLVPAAAFFTIFLASRPRPQRTLAFRLAADLDARRPKFRSGNWLIEFTQDGALFQLLVSGSVYDSVETFTTIQRLVDGRPHSAELHQKRPTGRAAQSPAVRRLIMRSDGSFEADDASPLVGWETRLPVTLAAAMRDLEIHSIFVGPEVASTVRVGCTASEVRVVATLLNDLAVYLAPRSTPGRRETR